MADRRPIAITGPGAVSALGVGVAALWRGMDEGREGIRAVTRFDTTTLVTTWAGQLTTEHDALLAAGPDRCSRYALTAATEAWQHARVDQAGIEPKRLGIAFGTSSGRGTPEMHGFAEVVAERLGIFGPRLTISTACSSSGAALGVARQLLLGGEVDLVLAGGSDELVPGVFAGFSALGVMSSEPCAPFSLPPGMTLGEGAGFAVLEHGEHAAARGAKALGYLLGHALSADAHHATAPDPSGQGVVRVLTAVLEEAGLAAEEVGYVNLHGTGTLANDGAEWKAVHTLLGLQAATTPVSSSKGQLGHTQGAAGILEAALTLHGLRTQRLPQTLHFEAPRATGPADPVGERLPRPHQFEVALSTNSGFGGANAAVVLGRAPVNHPSAHDVDREPALRPVYVLGAGAVGAHGLELADFDEALASGRGGDGLVPPFRLESLVRGLDPRGLDPSARFLSAAVAQALADAGLRVRGALRERSGVIAGASRLSPASVAEFEGSVKRRGLANPSATAFARMVLNAPAGACSMGLALRGPTTTLTTGAGSGLMALVIAADMLARRDDAELLAAGGYDELEQAPREAARGETVRKPRQSEGAGCLLLGRASALRASTAVPTVRIAGWAVSGPSEVGDAIARTLARGGVRPAEVQAVFGRNGGWRSDQLPALQPELASDPACVVGYAPAASSALAAVAAFQALRQHRCDNGLVVTAEGSSASAALLLVRQECET